MGREASAQAEANGRSGTVHVHVLLESTELILRGSFRRRFRLDALTERRLDDDALCFRFGTESVVIRLGAGLAGIWAKAMVTPPPSLRSKLGLAAGARAFCVGSFDDGALEAAVSDCRIADMSRSDLMNGDGSIAG